LHFSGKFFPRNVVFIVGENLVGYEDLVLWRLTISQFVELNFDWPSDGSGSKIFNPGWVSHLWFGFEFGRFPLKMSNFSIFFLWTKQISSGRVKKYLGSKAGWPLIYCRSKVSSTRVGSGPISRLTRPKKRYCISHDYEAPWRNKCGIFWEKLCVLVWIIGVFFVQKMKCKWGNNLLVFLGGR